MCRIRPPSAAAIPVTSDLPGLPSDPTKTPPWGRWFLDVEGMRRAAMW